MISAIAIATFFKSLSLVLEVWGHSNAPQQVLFESHMQKITKWLKVKLLIDDSNQHKKPNVHVVNILKINAY